MFLMRGDGLTVGCCLCVKFLLQKEEKKNSCHRNMLRKIIYCLIYFLIIDGSPQFQWKYYNLMNLFSIWKFVRFSRTFWLENTQFSWFFLEMVFLGNLWKIILCKTIPWMNFGANIAEWFFRKSMIRKLYSQKIVYSKIVF